MIISKADDEFEQRAALAAADVQQALRFIPPRSAQWQVPVLQVSAKDKKNIDLLWSELSRFRDSLENSGGLETRRKQQLKSWLWNETRELLLSTLHNDDINESLSSLEERVADGKLTPTVAARKLVSGIFENSNPSSKS